MRKLGWTQQAVINAMRERHGGVWYEGCGWIWDTMSSTRRIMDALAKRGIVHVTEDASAGRHNMVVRRVYKLVDGQQGKPPPQDIGPDIPR